MRASARIAADLHSGEMVTACRAHNRLEMFNSAWELYFHNSARICTGPRALSIILCALKTRVQAYKRQKNSWLGIF